MAEKSVAVLAFEHRSDDKANALFSDGLSEDLIGSPALEPKFARAYAALADVGLMGGQDADTVGLFNQRRSPEFGRILDQIRHALALDPDLPEAHASLGNAEWIAGNFTAAERELRRAIELNPSDASAHQWLGRVLDGDGRLAEARAEIKLAGRTRSACRANFGQLRCGLLLDLSRREEAIAIGRQPGEERSNRGGGTLRCSALGVGCWPFGRALDARIRGRMATPMQGHTVIKTVRITRALNATLTRRARAEKKDFSEVWREAVTRGLKESEGIDMAGALHGIIGKYGGSGESQESRMSRYGRARHR